MLSTLRSTLSPILIPALTSGAVLYTINFCLGKSSVDTKEILMDIGAIVASHAAASVLTSLIPTFSSSKYNSFIDASENYLLVPVLATLIYEYLYGKTVRVEYSNYSSSLKGATFNLGVGFGSIIASNVISAQICGWVM